MNILYLDLNCSSFFESYSCEPQKYGGAGCFGRFAKELLNNDKDKFYILAPKECFEELTDKENKSVCISTPKEVFEAIKAGYPIDQIIGNLDKFDMICYHNSCQGINKGKFKGPLVHWSGSGRADAAHPTCDYSLLYNQEEKQIFPNTKIKYIKIGKPVSSIFKSTSTKEGVFQCSHHCKDFNTIEVAQNCIKYGIKGIFAGPITDYNLMDYIDNKNTFYIGIISEKDKLEYCRKAKLTTYLHKWDTVFNLSVIESWSVGTPILANKRGFFKNVLKENINGFFYDRTNFLECYRKSDKIDQRLCWESAREFSIENMVSSFYQAFTEIKNEWIYK